MSPRRKLQEKRIHKTVKSQASNLRKGNKGLKSFVLPRGGGGPRAAQQRPEKIGRPVLLRPDRENLVGANEVSVIRIVDMLIKNHDPKGFTVREIKEMLAKEYCHMKVKITEDAVRKAIKQGVRERRLHKLAESELQETTTSSARRQRRSRSRGRDSRRHSRGSGRCSRSWRDQDRVERRDRRSPERDRSRSRVRQQFRQQDRPEN